MNENLQKYAFVLGSNPMLSISEILNVFDGEKNIKYIDASEEVMLATGTDIKSTDINRLGGTIKIIKVTHTIKLKEYNPTNLIHILANIIKEKPSSDSGKFHLGISVYNLDASNKNIYRFSHSIRFFYINIKKALKQDKTNVAFLNTKDRFLSSASVIKNDLLKENGLELSIVLTRDTILIGTTIAVQDIDAYSQKDIGRPQRDLLSGTTPPKLAKLMINLCTVNTSSTILDPFCGSGTFIQEMKMLGFENILGSDISDKAIKDTEENLDWLFKTFGFNNRQAIRIIKADAQKLSQVYQRESVDAVVSEVYLGPPLRYVPTYSEAEGVAENLTKMYVEVLKELSVILKKGGRIVLAMPAIKSSGGLVLLSIEEAIRSAGLRIHRFTKFGPGVSQSILTKRNTVIYSRPDQKVRREIIVLEKNDITK